MYRNSKKIVIVVVFILSFFAFLPFVSATSGTNNVVNFCADTDILKGLRVIGYLIGICKILVPVLIIFFGIKSFSGIVFSDKNNNLEIKEHVYLLIKKIIVSVAIFLIPTIIDLICVNIAGYQKMTEPGSGDFTQCLRCVVSVTDCDSIIGDN